MRSAITLLVLLFSMCGVQTESQSTGAAAAAVTTTLDVSTELRELRDMVVELRVLLTVTQNELQNAKAEIDAQDNELTAVKTEMMNLINASAAQEAELAVMTERLEVSETKVEALERVNSAQDTELTAVNNWLAANEIDMEDLKMETAEIKAEMVNLKMANGAQEAELTAVKTRLAATETEVENLKKEITEQPKVAFSAGLTNSGYINSGNTEINLNFTEIITNVGEAYSSTTGFFTAPVRGVYYFRFTVMDALRSRFITIRMFKNGEQVMYLSGYDQDGGHTFLSSGVTLQLEVGDVVNMRLPGSHRLYSDANNYSTFSGFLLFAL